VLEMQTLHVPSLIPVVIYLRDSRLVYCIVVVAAAADDDDDETAAVDSVCN
jgi:hypothetical protein